MQIKISKSQWEGIGKQTGWIKEAHGGNMTLCETEDQAVDLMAKKIFEGGEEYLKKLLKWNPDVRKHLGAQVGVTTRTDTK